MGGSARSKDKVVASGVTARQWKWIKFECFADPGSKVFIAGTFNNWRPSGLGKLRDSERDGTFGILLKLRKGRHEYQFVVNGEWLSGNQDATLNSVTDVV